MKPIRAYVTEPDATRLSFTASTEGTKRDGLDLDLDGLSIDNYMRNPVFLWAHDYGGRTLPIGKVTGLQRSGDSLRAEIEFDQDDPFAVAVERKYRNGYLSAVSIGWDIHKMEGSRVLESELLDISAVPVPGDPDALMERQKMALRAWGRHALAGDPEVVSEAAQLVESDDVVEWRIVANEPGNTTITLDKIRESTITIDKLINSYRESAGYREANPDDLTEDPELPGTDGPTPDMMGQFISVAEKFIEKAEAFLSSDGEPNADDEEPIEGDLAALLEAFDKETEDV